MSFNHFYVPKFLQFVSRPDGTNVDYWSEKSDPWPLHPSNISVSRKAFLTTIFNCHKWQIPHHVVNWKQVFLNPQHTEYHSQCNEVFWKLVILVGTYKSVVVH